MWLPESEAPEIDITGIEPERAGPQRYGVFISEQVQTFNKASKLCRRLRNREARSAIEAAWRLLFFFFPNRVYFSPSVVSWRPSLANRLTKSARLQSVSARRAGVNFFTSRN